MSFALLCGQNRSKSQHMDKISKKTQIDINSEEISTGDFFFLRVIIFFYLSYFLNGSHTTGYSLNIHHKKYSFLDKC